MKYLLVLGDGMADEPLAELGGKTPLEYAKTPVFDRLAREGATGLVRTVPDGYEAGSDIANLSILGYDPRTFYTGRGPLEAMSMGVRMAEEDVAYRCNLVTVTDGIMADFSAGHISSSEGAALLGDLQKRIPDILVKPGVSYRNLLMIHNGKGSRTTPPHDIVGQQIQEYLPQGSDAPLLAECVSVSRDVFQDHPVNRARLAAGKPPANQIWPWSGGRKPAMPAFREKYGKQGGMISAVDLLNGIATCAGMERIMVPGATGYLDTDYHAKALYAIQALTRLDFLYLHVEAPDEAGHLGSVEEKVRAIERVDEMVGMILESFDGTVAVLPDHPTPIRLKTHTNAPVPFVIRGKITDSTQRLTEREAEKGKYGIREATSLLDLIFS
ncbi:MAG: cofactor-independent phosphoglycerate mutase [Methanoregulaceae archaeon]